MAYEAIDIANFLVRESRDKGESLTNIGLQKILYYLQAQYLIDTGEPLFNDEIQKWKLGPVVPSTYQEFKNFGSAPIESLSEKFNIGVDENGNVKVEIKNFDEKMIQEQDREKIRKTFQKLYQYGAFELVDRTHKQSIWYLYKPQILAGEGNIPYTNEEIEEYFTLHESEQLWQN